MGMYTRNRYTTVWRVVILKRHPNITTSFFYYRNIKGILNFLTKLDDTKHGTYRHLTTRLCHLRAKTPILSRHAILKRCRGSFHKCEKYTNIDAVDFSCTLKSSQALFPA